MSAVPMNDDVQYRFHAHVYARPTAATPGEIATLRGRPLPTLDVRPEDALAGFDVTFETLAENWSAEPRLFFEPDGSFVWRSGADEPPWQLDGMVYDRDDRVRYVELKGQCSPSQLARLLEPLAGPERAVMFQLAQEGIFLAEPEFRIYAALS